jgi:hypothetical protein
LSEIDYKFNEGELIEEIKSYIDATYGEHYACGKIQSTEIAIDRGRGMGFCLGNVDKYSGRYGHKGTTDDWRKDLLKVIHYAIISLYIHDKEHIIKKFDSPIYTTGLQYTDEHGNVVTTIGSYGRGQPGVTGNVAAIGCGQVSGDTQYFQET